MGGRRAEGTGLIKSFAVITDNSCYQLARERMRTHTRADTHTHTQFFVFRERHRASQLPSDVEQGTVIFCTSIITPRKKKQSSQMSWQNR